MRSRVSKRVSKRISKRTKRVNKRVSKRVNKRYKKIKGGSAAEKGSLKPHGIPQKANPLSGSILPGTETKLVLGKNAAEYLSEENAKDARQLAENSKLNPTLVKNKIAKDQQEDHERQPAGFHAIIAKSKAKKRREQALTAKAKAERYARARALTASKHPGNPTKNP
jgi:hypothetical protein